MNVNAKNYYEDLELGFRYETPGITVGEAHVLGFAGLTGDFTPVHVDEQFAREMGFRGRLAHGLLVMGLIDALKNRCLVEFHVVAALNWTWRFCAPVHVGDRLHVEVCIADRRLTSKGNRGIVTLDLKGLNQDGVIVQEGQTQIMVLCRPPDSAH